MTHVPKCFKIFILPSFPLYSMSPLLTILSFIFILRVFLDLKDLTDFRLYWCSLHIFSKPFLSSLNLMASFFINHLHPYFSPVFSFPLLFCIISCPSCLLPYLSFSLWGLLILNWVLFPYLGCQKEMGSSEAPSHDKMHLSCRTLCKIAYTFTNA